MQIKHRAKLDFFECTQQNSTKSGKVACEYVIQQDCKLVSISGARCTNTRRLSTKLYLILLTLKN